MKPPGRIVGADGTFRELTARGPNMDEFQRASHAATEHSSRIGMRTSVLVENMIGAYGQRCDRLMAELQVGLAHPALMQPEHVAALYHEGVLNETWMFWWNGEREVA